MSIHQMAEFSFSVAISLHLTFLIGRANMRPWAVTVSRGGIYTWGKLQLQFSSCFFFFMAFVFARKFIDYNYLFCYITVCQSEVCVWKSICTLNVFWRYVVSIKPNKSWVELGEEISMVESYLTICSYFTYLMYVL